MASTRLEAPVGCRVPLLIADGDIPTTRILARLIHAAVGGVEVRTPETLFGAEIAGRAILVSRLCLPTLRWLPRYLSERGASYRYFLDDCFWELGPDIDPHLAPYFEHPAVRDTLDRWIAGAQATLVMSKRLGRYIQDRFPRATVEWLVPGFDVDRVRLLQATMAPSGKRDGAIRIGYPTSRRPNVAGLLANVIRRIVKRHAGRVRFEFVGWAPDEVVGMEGVSLSPFVDDYDAYLAFKLGRAWDIGIAPLAGTPFEAYKTNVKYREFGGCGIAGVYSRVPLYEDYVSHECTGLLVENCEQAWVDALERLMADAALRVRIAEAARADVEAHYNHRETIGQLRSMLQVDAGRRSTSTTPGDEDWSAHRDNVSG